MYTPAHFMKLRSAIALAVALALSLSVLTCFKTADTNANDVSDSFPSDSTVIDIDGNIHHTVTIGAQVWMVENLKVTRYRDGTTIPTETNDTVWSMLTTGALCWYDNDSGTYKDTYGALYNFYAVIDDRGLCPEGWHVPTETEWRELETFLGGQAVAGGKMKEVGTTHWTDPNIGATDESGFCGLPGGGRGQITGTGELGNYATWWTSTSYDSAYAWHWGLYHGNASVRRNPGHKASGFSVRCIRD